MDTSLITLLVTNTASALQPYWPIIAGGVAKEVGSKLPVAISKLWNLLSARFAKKPTAQDQLADLLKSPDDADLQAAFRVQLRKILQEDDEFTNNLRELVEQTTTNISQGGMGNVLAPGIGNIISQNQQGGITAQSVVINNISKNAEPTIEVSEVFSNKPEGDKFLTRLHISIISQHPIGNLFLGVKSSTVESIQLKPTRAGVYAFGPDGVRPGYAFANTQNASGKLELDIFTKEPETFKLEYKID